MKSLRSCLLFGRSVFGLFAVLLVVVIFANPAMGDGGAATQGIGEGHPPRRADLSPAQKRLMARRAAEIRALREALRQTVGAPRPDQVQTGQIEIRGRIGSYRTLESRELPDGRWRTVVEVTVPRSPETQPEDLVGLILTDYLEFRSGLLRSRGQCEENEARLQRDLAEAEESIRQAIVSALNTSRADLTIIDRALADLEAETLKRLSPPTTSTTPSQPY